MRFLRSLTWRMALGMLAINVLLIPLLFGGVLYIVKQGYQDQFVNHVRSDAASFADRADEFMDKNRHRAILDDAVMSGRLVYADVLNDRGQALTQVDATGGRASFREDFFFGQHGDQIYFIALPLSSQNGQAPGTIRLGYDESGTQEQILLAYRRGLYLAAAYLILTMTLVGFIGPAVTKPIRRLQNASRKIAYGHFKEQLQVTSYITELQNLAGDLNLMRGELVKQADTLQHQALHDGLTGLPNRTLLQDRLQQAMHVAERSSQTLALLLMDLNHFKEVNDTMGHAAGDVILQQTAKRLQQAARESDTVARLGGDEFALVLLTASEEDVRKIARHMVNAIQNPFTVDGQQLHIGTSIGIALCQGNGVDFDTLLRRADIAMYESKRTHNAFTMYEPALDRNSLSQLVLSGELAKGIEHNEFLLHYQPKIIARTGELQGVEVLVRWQHPGRGRISPEEFIPLAEKTGFITPLTQWILEEALKQWRQWQDLGMPVNIAVNLSAHCLQDELLPSEILALLQKYHAPPASLTLELTESAIMADPIRARQTFARLHIMGARLSIDDFGTGYSSLTHLKKLPLHEIKIDKSFVMDMLSDDSNAAIVQTMISLAHDLGITVVAEGVEQELALHLLKRMGCDFVQGHYIGKPVGAAEFERWYRESFTVQPTRPLVADRTNPSS